MYTKGEVCSVTVFEERGWRHQCQKKAVIERDRKHFCKIHDPEYQRAKFAERQAKWEQDWGRQRVDCALKDTAVQACKSINPDNPLAVANSIKDMYEALKAIKPLCSGAAFSQDIERQVIAGKCYLALAKAEVK